MINSRRSFTVLTISGRNNKEKSETLLQNSSCRTSVCWLVSRIDFKDLLKLDPIFELVQATKVLPRHILRPDSYQGWYFADPEGHKILSKVQ